MLLEEQRYIAEDLERLEQGIADRMGEEPKLVCRDTMRAVLLRPKLIKPPCSTDP